VEFRILGPLEVVSDSTVLEVPWSKCRALLTLLVMRANEVVSADRLIDELWEEGPPESAPGTLQTYVYRLRKSLPQAALRTRAGGYALEAARSDVDALRFADVVADAARRGDASPEWVDARLREALSWWRGDAMIEFARTSWARRERVRLDALRLDALQMRTEARLAMGDHSAVVGELESLVTEYPLRERAWGQLMLALYRCGRQADALRAYSRLRRHLGDELGIEPSRDLVHLEEAILLQKPELDHRPRTRAALGTEQGARARSHADVASVLEAWEQAAARALVGLGAAQHQAGDPEAPNTLLDAARLAQRVGDAKLLVRAALANNRRSAAKVGSVDAERVVLLQAALSTAGTEAAERASLLALLGAELTWADGDRARALSDDALALARRSADDEQLWDVLAMRPSTIWSPATLGERVANAREQLAVATRLGDDRFRWSALGHLSNAMMCRGDVDTADELADVVLRHLGESGLVPHRALVARHHAWRKLLAGEIEEAEAAALSSFELLRDSGDPDASLVYVSQLFDVRRAQGRLGDVVERGVRAAVDNHAAPAQRAALAAALCELGRIDDARDLFAPLATNCFADVRFDVTWLTAMTACAETVAALDDQGAAQAVAEALRPWRDQLAFAVITCRGSVERPLGLALTTARRLDEADEAFDQAAAVHARIDAPIELARTQVDWAGMLVRRARRGDVDAARALAEKAGATAARLGLPTISRKAEALLS
jgi:DNA-binding SARP family transcriptional activator